MLKPTKTTNRLHFSDLDPKRFEDICFQLLSAHYKWKELVHIGREGNDGGVDIRGIQTIESVDQHWLIQCKRYIRITQVELKKVIDTIVLNYQESARILIIVACDVSKAKHDFIIDYCEKSGISRPEIWAVSNLETILYKYPKILELAFGITKEQQTKNNIQKINAGIKMKEKVYKTLIDHKFTKNPTNRQTILDYPARRFISAEVYIRDVNDNTYPNMAPMPEGVISSWFRATFYDLYHSGIELWLATGHDINVLMRNDGLWEPLHERVHSQLNNPDYRLIPAKMIGKIPYHKIKNLIPDGDEYISEPHLFCTFDGEDDTPYEEVYYKSFGYPDEGTIDWEFDRSKQTTF